jgi:hypothetical protein
VLPINRATPALDQTECIAHARITGLLLKRIILRSIPAFFLELKPGIVTIGLLNGPLTITTTITQFAIRFSFVRGVCSSRQNTVSCANWDRVRVAACDVMKKAQ